MPAHRPAPGRHRLQPHLLARHIDRNGSHYSTGYPCLPFRLSLFTFVVFLGVVAAFGVTVAPADPPQPVSFVSADAPAVAPVVWKCRP